VLVTSGTATSMRRKQFGFCFQLQKFARRIRNKRNHFAQPAPDLIRASVHEKKSHVADKELLTFVKIV
jgi:hypothetical protein